MAIAEEVFNPSGVTRNATNPFGDGSELALYKFEDNVNDAEGSYDGSASNVTYTAGHIDKAAVFNGSNSQMTTTTNIPITGSFSISLWIKQVSNSDYTRTGTIVDFGYNSSPDMFLWIDNGIARLSHPGGDYYYTSATTQGVWNHILITRNASNTTSYYLNGSLDSTNTGWTTNTNHKFTIGYSPIRNSGSSGRLAGSIDQVRIFDRALDSGEVTQLYNE